MKNLLKITMSFLILSVTGLAMANGAMVQTNPVVTSEVSADTSVSANTGAGMVNARGDINEGSAGVNETDPIEVDKADLRDSDVNIDMARKDVIRDTGKLSDDKTKLGDAQTAKDDQAAVKKDRERLKKNLENKIENDKAIVRLFDEKIKDGREDVVRGTRKISDDTTKLADAQKRYVADEIERRKTVVENDKTIVDADTEKLNRRIADKAEYVMELKTDSRHLDAVVKHLSEEDETPVTDNRGAENKSSVKL